MTKKTDPQMFESGYDRNRLDRYWTNPWMTDELFKHCAGEIPKVIWECAAGRGDMSRAIAEHKRLVYSSDIDMSEFDKDIGPGHERSFLDEFELPEYVEEGAPGDTPMRGPVRGIITNPPYNEPWRGIADDFIRKGLGFFDQSGITFMAMLLRSEFRSGKSRKDMFGECNHYLGELVLTTRPRWDYGDPDAPETAAPRHNVSWFLWGLHAQNYGRPFQLFSYMPKGFKP